MRMHIVRFWKQVLILGKTIEDLDTLLNGEVITQEEYDAIIAP